MGYFHTEKSHFLRRHALLFPRQKSCSILPYFYELIWLSQLDRSHELQKRDNSCLVYIDQTDTVCWGVLEKIFSFKNSTASGYYCLISVLLPTSTQLCMDDITHAQLHKHLVACEPPRCVLAPFNKT